MKYFYIIMCIFGCNSLAMQPADVLLLKQFKTMRTRDLDDPAMIELFKMAMKYSIIRGHQLWKVYKHPLPLSQSIPGSVVASARRVLVMHIQDQKKPLRESIDRVKADIDQEYQIKIEKSSYPIILPKGWFTTGELAPINAIYNYYGLKYFDIIQKIALCYFGERDQDCAFTFFDKGVKSLLIAESGDTIEYRLLKSLFVKESKDKKCRYASKQHSYKYP